MSHPSWVCGLKLSLNDCQQVALIVTPFVGVWIEPRPVATRMLFCAVTLFVGVWIETCQGRNT